ncbi:ROK family protein [Candidatus Pacearchaeota archaeon]|nr:ROK family protein [Candidatus Pacearchaeota archaeon]
MSVIGIDLGGTKIKVGVVSNNKLCKVISKKINSKASKNNVIKQIMDVIDIVFTKDIEAIGVGVPAIVDVDKGIVFEVNNIASWKNVKLKKILEKKYKVPVIINNDANCFALGEKYLGCGMNFDNVVGLTLGTGVGAGIIINKKLYSGKNCGAGEFGEVLYNCKNYEVFCSGQLYSKYNLDGKTLSNGARKGNKKFKKIFNEQGYHIGKLLATIANSVDPEIIILGGSVSNDFKFFKKSMMKSLKESTYARTYSCLKIKKSNNPDIAVIGAAFLYKDSIL